MARSRANEKKLAALKRELDHLYETSNFQVAMTIATEAYLLTPRGEPQPKWVERIIRKMFEEILKEMQVSPLQEQRRRDYLRYWVFNWFFGKTWSRVLAKQLSEKALRYSGETIAHAYDRHRAIHGLPKAARVGSLSPKLYPDAPDVSALKRILEDSKSR